MSQSVTLTGMVLTSMPVGEYDRRIVLLTKERGKITAFVRGARRPKSSMVAATNPFCFGTFEAYEGRTAYTVVKAEISNYFLEVSSDLEKTYYGCYFLELAEYFTVENGTGTEQLKLLYQTLRALCAKSLPDRLVRCVYELKSLVYYGIYPDFFTCTQCKKQEQMTWFHPGKNGCICAKCHPPSGAVRLDDSTFYALQFIVASSVEKLYTFQVKEGVLLQLEQMSAYCMRLAVDKKFRSLQFLEDMLNFV